MLCSGCHSASLLSSYRRGEKDGGGGDYGQGSGLHLVSGGASERGERGHCSGFNGRLSAISSSDPQRPRSELGILRGVLVLGGGLLLVVQSASLETRRGEDEVMVRDVIFLEQHLHVIHAFISMVVRLSTTSRGTSTRAMTVTTKGFI